MFEASIDVPVFPAARVAVSGTRAAVEEARRTRTALRLIRRSREFAVTAINTADDVYRYFVIPGIEYIDNTMTIVKEHVTAGVAVEVERMLKSRRSLWPDSPETPTWSGDEFFTRVNTKEQEIEVHNRAPFAKVVNYRRRYASGAPNPNYLAAQRTVEKYWRTIVRRAQRQEVQDA